MKILWAKSGGLLPSDTGGKIRSFNIARELAKRHEVTLFMSYSGMTDPHYALRDQFERVECVKLDLPERASVQDTLAYAANAFTTKPYQMRKYCRPQMRQRLADTLRNGQYDALLCDFLLTAGAVPWNIKVPTVLFTHNVEQVIWQRHLAVNSNPLWKMVAWREYRTIQRMERRYTELADHVLTVSDHDRKFFLEFLSDEKVTTVPTGVDLDYFRPSRPAERSNTLVFTGSMDWLPNEDAIVYFCDQILPLISQRIPDVSLCVVGRQPTRKVLALKERHPRVLVTGTVDDIRPYVRDAAVYVVPLRIGGGTRIKIFEAMALGKAVVSTSIGAEGLPIEHGKNIFLADTPEEFAARTIALLTQPDVNERLGAAARALVESRYGWPAVTDVVDRVLQRVAG